MLPPPRTHETMRRPPNTSREPWRRSPAFVRTSDRPHARVRALVEDCLHEQHEEEEAEPGADEHDDGGGPEPDPPREDTRAAIALLHETQPSRVAGCLGGEASDPPATIACDRDEKVAVGEKLDLWIALGSRRGEVPRPASMSTGAVPPTAGASSSAVTSRDRASAPGCTFFCAAALASFPACSSSSVTVNRPTTRSLGMLWAPCRHAGSSLHFTAPRTPGRLREQWLTI